MSADEIGVGIFNLMEENEWGLYVTLKLYEGGKVISDNFMVANRDTKERRNFVSFREALSDFQNQIPSELAELRADQRRLDAMIRWMNEGSDGRKLDPGIHMLPSDRPHIDHAIEVEADAKRRREARDAKPI